MRAGNHFPDSQNISQARERAALPAGAASRAALSGALESMIVSPSGWRAVFAEGGGEDAGERLKSGFASLAALAADAFMDFLAERYPGRTLRVTLARDTRPTGRAAAEAMLRAFLARGAVCAYAGQAALPEIAAYRGARHGFAYVSASHNPVGHNGFKFGEGKGGVLPPERAAALAERFREKCAAPDAAERAAALLAACPEAAFREALARSADVKRRAFRAYLAFSRGVPGGSGMLPARAGIAADFNGSARARSIDAAYFAGRGAAFYAVNADAIVHGIVPEGGNLREAAAFLEALRAGTCAAYPGKHPDALLAYGCDCDGDRGNIVYYDEAEGRAKILSAQEVFALCTLASLASEADEGARAGKRAVVCNCPTSLRIEAIARVFGARVFRAEVGEANAAALARKARRAGYAVPAAGEGSNGGCIVYPAQVRDPLNTVSLVLRLLSGGAFRRWLRLSGQAALRTPAVTLADAVRSLPAWYTTGVTEERARLAVRERDPAGLKRRFQRRFEAWWEAERRRLRDDFGLVSWTAVATNGVKETRGIADFGLSGAGGLKALFRDEKGEEAAFMWMRGSGTEPVFRLLCDARGSAETEAFLLRQERRMLQEAGAEG